jgi:hypothetical protein
MVKRFEKVYGLDGSWVRLLAQDESYIGTELTHHLKGLRSYVTLDFWTSQEAYNGFRQQHLAQYKPLDWKCGELTESEQEIGGFVRVSNK